MNEDTCLTPPCLQPAGWFFMVVKIISDRARFLIRSLQTKEVTE